jgi:hypothetical protein
MAVVRETFQEGCIARVPQGIPFLFPDYSKDPSANESLGGLPTKGLFSAV